MQEQAKRSLSITPLGWQAEWTWLQPPVTSPMKKGERKHARGAGPASPLVSQTESSAFMHLIFRFYEPPTFPSVNLFFLISLELTFCYFQWKESRLILCGTCQALPAFGICSCSSSSLECSLQKLHDSLSLPSSWIKRPPSQWGLPWPFSLNYAHTLPYFPYQYLLYHVIYWMTFWLSLSSTRM